MKNICTIGMRGGSKGVKNKNLKEINGKPLIQYTVDQALESELFDHIVVSTDSREIQDLAVSCGAESWFLRPSHMATDSAAKLPVVEHTLLESQKHFSEEYDVIVDLDVTCPLRTSEDIRQAYRMMIKKDADNLISVCEARKNPYFNMVELVDGIPCLVKSTENRPVRRQDSPKVFEMNAAIFMWQTRTSFSYQSLLTKNTILFEMPQERSVDIDSETDWNFVEFMMQRNETV